MTAAPARPYTIGIDAHGRAAAYQTRGPSEAAARACGGMSLYDLPPHVTRATAKAWARDITAAAGRAAAMDDGRPRAVALRRIRELLGRRPAP